MITALERVAIVLAAFALAVAVIALLSGGLFTGSDQPAVAGSVSGPGQPYRIAPDDPLKSKLRLGDVALIYRSAKPPAALRALARRVALPVSPATGQAVILSSRPGVHGFVGEAWERIIRVTAPTDPRLRAFVEFWLGRGAAR